jgi:hypothetical protein
MNTDIEIEEQLKHVLPVYLRKMFNNVILREEIYKVIKLDRDWAIRVLELGDMYSEIVKHKQNIVHDVIGFLELEEHYVPII